MKFLESTLQIAYHIFHALAEACWAGTEILRIRREMNEPVEPEKKKRERK